MHVWRAAAESWIADQENQEGKQACALDNVVYAKPLRIRMKLPGLPGVFHACCLAREVAYDAFRELCAKENLRRVVKGPKVERFGKECRKINLSVGRESVVHLHKTDLRGAKITVPVRTHMWMQLHDFRLEPKQRRKRITEKVVVDEELPSTTEPARRRSSDVTG